ncbi:uncharacterized protein J3D65DRAFT_180799 [Phyllosticta citribraziliensis]|uniref:F-box domain-containing protein n=1 Tax=Phyllosticta citribraziliensis TaxID=989973 RepID=A0ABR1L386_9PEZI
MAERNATDPLRALPGELQNEIFKHLDYPAAMLLASTNRYFRRVVNPLTQVSDEDKLVFLRYALCFLEQNRHKPACFTCFRVKERHHFPAQSAVHSVDGTGRSCFSCGAEEIDKRVSALWEKFLPWFMMMGCKNCGRGRMSSTPFRCTQCFPSAPWTAWRSEPRLGELAPGWLPFSDFWKALIHRARIFQRHPDGEWYLLQLRLGSPAMLAGLF